MYAVHCANDSHELYDMSKDPGQMKNLHPKAPQPVNQANFLGRPIQQVIHRIDALLLVLKSCDGDSCRQPWKQLHPGGQANTLIEALDTQFDSKYADLNNNYPVKYKQCFKTGKLDLQAEGIQWQNVPQNVAADGGARTENSTDTVVVDDTNGGTVRLF